jgi:cytochrome c oxidase cbb3-type subunit 1
LRRTRDGHLAGTAAAFPTANIHWHFTNFTVGHSHAAMYGFIAFTAWGAVYGLMPRFTGREPNPLAVGSISGSRSSGS